MLVPFLTLCQEQCPITTGELLVIHRTLVADKLTGNIEIVELSVDPGRDSPARLSAYSHLAGLSWTLLTTTEPQSGQAVAPSKQATISAATEESTNASAPQSLASTHLEEIAKYFGWLVQRIPEGSPPATDWWTGQPLTYDINHSDGFALIDAKGSERFETVAPATTGGNLSPALSNLLDAQGRANLKHPSSLSWKVDDALNALGWLLGRPVAPG